MGHDLETYLSNYQEYPDEDLIHLVSLRRWFSDPIHVEAAEKTLEKRGFDVSKFDEDFFIQQFLKITEAGWVPDVKAMFDELLQAGWNLKTPIKAKEKYGDFICDINTENNKLLGIVKKFSEKINRTCSSCSSIKSVGYDYSSNWIEKLCEDCQIKNLESITIRTISNLGFTCSNHLFNNKETRIEWQYVSKVDVEFESPGAVSSLRIHLKSAAYNIDYLYISSDYTNFYLLLNHIPISLLTQEDSGKINFFLGSLKDCKVCGYVAVYSEKCLFCQSNLNEILNDNPTWKRYNNIEEIVKEEQIHYFLYKSRNLEKKYKIEHDLFFVKFTGYRKLFKNHELTEK